METSPVTWCSAESKPGCSVPNHDIEPQKRPGNMPRPLFYFLRHISDLTRSSGIANFLIFESKILDKLKNRQSELARTWVHLAQRMLWF